MRRSPKVRAVLFDLDGTLADTSADMTDALNELLTQHDKDTLAYDLTRQSTSRGSLALIELGFGEPLKEKLGLQLRDEFFQIYAGMLCNKTQLFPGVSVLLDFLDQTNIPWGIVTNKPGRFTEPLIQALDIASRTKCTVSGDSISNNKPSPDPLLHAAKLLDLDAIDCLYMGDDPRDIQAGKAANMKTAVAAYGYIHDDQDPYNWGADVVLENAQLLKDWLFTHN